MNGLSDISRETQVGAAVKKLQLQTEVAHREFDNLLQLISPILNPNALEEVGMNDLNKPVPSAPQCSLAEVINMVIAQLQNLTNKIVYTNGRVEL